MTPARINQHWLIWDHPQVELVRKRERTAAIIVPELILIHYGVTSSLPALVAAQRATGYMAQFSIDGYASPGPNYQIRQMYPCNEYGSHAGESQWSEKAGCNAFAIGVEIANPGPLIRGADGQLRTVYGQVWPEEDAIEMRHPGGRAPQNWTHWAAYSDQEIDILIELCRALIDAYPTISGIAGHDEVSPGRKFDPGPAFPMQWLREKFEFAAQLD